jgi:hypothetical protein
LLSGRNRAGRDDNLQNTSGQLFGPAAIARDPRQQADQPRVLQPEDVLQAAAGRRALLRMEAQRDLLRWRPH